MPIPTIRKMRFRGSIVWEVDARAMAKECRPRGIPLRRKFPSKAAAEDWAAKVMDRIREVPEVRERVRDLCDAFVESRRTAVSTDTISNYGTAINHLVAFCERQEHPWVDQLGPSRVGEFIDRLRGKVSRDTVDTYIGSLSGCFTWAVERGYITHNPFEGKAPGKGRSSRRTLTDEERRKIVTEAQLRDLWALVLNTGLRAIEVTRLDAETVRLDSPAPHLKVLGKGDRERTVPLDSAAVRWARRLLERHAGRLWPTGRDQLHRAWRKDRQALGLPTEITLHVFRHDFASWLVNREGLPLPDVQRILGHSNLSTTATYLHPDGRRTGAALRGRGAELSGNSAVTREEKA